jgi:hypothetical protein
MDRLLPELHQGHAPITLHQLFREALETYDDWGDAAGMPVVVYEETHVPIIAVFEHMRDCTDILPNNMVGAITERLTKPWSGEGSLDEMTFSTAARIMCVLVRKKISRHGRADIAAFMRRMERRRPSRPRR